MMAGLDLVQARLAVAPLIGRKFEGGGDALVEAPFSGSTLVATRWLQGFAT
jgi:hypothetical protein